MPCVISSSVRAPSLSGLSPRSTPSSQTAQKKIPHWSVSFYALHRDDTKSLVHLQNYPQFAIPSCLPHILRLINRKVTARNNHPQKTNEKQGST